MYSSPYNKTQTPRKTDVLKYAQEPDSDFEDSIKDFIKMKFKNIKARSHNIHPCDVNTVNSLPVYNGRCSQPEVIMDVLIKMPLKAGFNKMEVTVDNGVKTNVFPLKCKSLMFPRSLNADKNPCKGSTHTI